MYKFDFKKLKDEYPNVFARLLEWIGVYRASTTNSALSFIRKRNSFATYFDPMNLPAFVSEQGWSIRIYSPSTSITTFGARAYRGASLIFEDDGLRSYWDALSQCLWQIFDHMEDELTPAELPVSEFPSREEAEVALERLARFIRKTTSIFCLLLCIQFPTFSQNEPPLGIHVAEQAVTEASITSFLNHKTDEPIPTNRRVLAPSSYL